MIIVCNDFFFLIRVDKPTAICVTRRKEGNKGRGGPLKRRRRLPVISIYAKRQWPRARSRGPKAAAKERNERQSSALSDNCFNFPCEVRL